MSEICPYLVLKERSFPGNDLLHSETDALEKQNEWQSEELMYSQYWMNDLGGEDGLEQALDGLGWWNGH